MSRNRCERQESAPAAPEHFFKNIPTAEVGEAENEKSPQVKIDGALATPAGKTPTREQQPEQDKRQQGKGRLVYQVLGEQILDECES